MDKNWRIPRRTFLKGVGTAMALPFLESMTPIKAANTARPVRMAFVYVPNGVNMADWTPGAEGSLGSLAEMPKILEPLRGLENEFQIVSGLAHRKADPNGDGPGDHARASATFLTGVQARKTAAVDIHCGVSVDQIAAEIVAKQTRLASLELGCDKGQQAGSCDSGYSCAYQFNLAWKTPTTPLPPEVDPRLVFERLFSNGKPGETEESRARVNQHLLAQAPHKLLSLRTA